MNCFSEKFNFSPEYQSIVTGIKKNWLPMGVLGLSHIHKAVLTASLSDKLHEGSIIITADEAQANRLVSDLKVLGKRALAYPARDYIFRSAESRSREYEHLRLGVLYKILCGEIDTVVCSVEAAMQLTIPPEELKSSSLELKLNDEISVEKITSLLIKGGYTKSEQVDASGQFAVRGGILDLYTPNSEFPCRIEFWGDNIDSISFFDTDSQRRTQSIDKIRVIPANEIVYKNKKMLINLINEHLSTVKGKGSVKVKASLNADIQKLESGVKLSSTDRYLPLVYPNAATIFDYAKGLRLFVSESFSVRGRAKACETLLNEDIKALLEEGTLCKGLDRYMLTWTEMLALYENKGAIYLDNLPRGSFDTPVKELVNINARQIPAWKGSFKFLLEDIEPLTQRDGWTCVIMAGTTKAAMALNDDLVGKNISSVFLPSFPDKFLPNKVYVISGTLSAGFEYPQEKFTLITYGSRGTSSTKSKKKKSLKNTFNNLDELHRGDYIVHDKHGIGVFEGITNLEASGTVKDYIKIKYDKGDVLYIPVTQLDQVSKYIGAGSETAHVKLSKLGGKDWQKARNRVRSAVKDMAQELIELYSKRKQITGFAFSPDIDMQNDFERRFEFEETTDQLRCVEEIKWDMEKPYPMDKLLCGDVGFGKTEVALRAAFKCVADGKQCAMLVPTTILALQHYQTIQKRFEGFPIEAAMLSRFCTPSQINANLKSVKRGSVDIVVGTHRLISKDVAFNDLGLIIIDEEQRFGVAQKERLKELFPSVDVLTLTATPIPRTLNMAMSGIRDMSVLEEAPQDRYPVQTYVIEHNMDVIAQAMTAEIRRGGQVYYLHNRVETIEKTASNIREFMPDATIAIAHGQMSEDDLSNVWRGLLEGEIDILVCTTIIETGVDVSNVNTLIIENADKMGLAQLHQIRGRVGRSPRRASAYLTFKRGKQLTEIAEKRLTAVREFTEFGAGFKIAMRDLELRGAGNILGAQQHGNMDSVGYDTYIKMLAQAISEEKGEETLKPERECLIDLPIDAHIPTEYIGSIPQKLAMYRRIADIRGKEDAQDVVDELIDRFGEPPASVMGLITVSLIRATAISQGVYEVGKKTDRLLLYIEDLNMPKITKLARKMHGRISVRAAGKPHIAIKLFPGEQQLRILEKAFEIMASVEK